jgi:3-methyladenine DNA glycosylase AlkD
MEGMELDGVLDRLKAAGDPVNVAGMARYGINPSGTLGVPMPVIRTLAKEIGRDHQLALRLWESGVHEARILAALIDDPARVTGEQMERGVVDFDSWDVCDQVCGKLFDRHPLAYDKAAAWSGRPEEFVKRAGFVLMAQLAVHDKKAADERFLVFLSMIEREAADERNYVRKGVNWALRQIGKRNARLNVAAVSTARRLLEQESRPARWVGRDALKELTSEAVRRRLG